MIPTPRRHSRVGGNPCLFFPLPAYYKSYSSNRTYSETRKSFLGTELFVDLASMLYRVNSYCFLRLVCFIDDAPVARPQFVFSFEFAGERFGD